MSATPSFNFDKNQCVNFESSTHKEWLETNGIGGYASSTISCTNTRKYHGLLVSSLNPPLGRYSIVSKLEETLIIDEARYDLSSNQYPGTIYPRGHELMYNFRLNPFPTFSYLVNDVLIEKSLFMVNGQNTIVVMYRVNSPTGNLKLRVRYLLSFRQIHATTRENPALNQRSIVGTCWVRVKPYALLPTLTIHHNASEYKDTSFWYKNMEYREDLYRGLECHEDLFTPGFFTFTIANTEKKWLVFTTEDIKDNINPEVLKIREIEHRKRAFQSLPTTDKVTRVLMTGYNHFIVHSKSGQRGIISGYPWFTERGRDALISLPGLMLVPNRTQEARELLTFYRDNSVNGFVPTAFHEYDDGKDYYGVDTSLWYINAAYHYLRHSSDLAFVKEELLDFIKKIIAAYGKRTPWITIDDDGLLYVDRSAICPTWMDSTLDGRMVVLRYGKIVEVNALWYNALRIAALLCRICGQRNEYMAYLKQSRVVKKSFNEVFWNPGKRCLYDYVAKDGFSEAIRPNQIFSISLPFKPLSVTFWKDVVAIAQNRLLTPYGLRTLEEHDPAYIGVCRGDTASRMQSYHQGTVWPWLLGPFFDAYTALNGANENTSMFIQSALGALVSRLDEGCLGLIAEHYDGMHPHHARGCFAQAWSAAETVRSYVKSLSTGKKPKVSHSVSHY